MSVVNAPKSPDFSAASVASIIACRSPMVVPSSCSAWTAKRGPAPAEAQGGCPRNVGPPDAGGVEASGRGDVPARQGLQLGGRDALPAAQVELVARRQRVQDHAADHHRAVA